LLRAIPFFSALPPAKLEHLASRLQTVHVAAGAKIFHQGDAGDRFYIIAEGEVEVEVDGQVGALLGPGGYFGEMALLHKAPRMATIVARTDLQLFALGRGDFLATVTSHRASAEAADAVIADRLASLRASGLTV
jgi:CRP-like cAMP-binding protein